MSQINPHILNNLIFGRILDIIPKIQTDTRHLDEYTARPDTAFDPIPDIKRQNSFGSSLESKKKRLIYLHGGFPLVL